MTQVFTVLRFTPPESFLPFAEAAQQEPPFGQQIFLRFREFLYQMSGIFIADNRRYFLKTRLLRRLQALGMHSFEEYFAFVTDVGPEAARERQELLNSIVVVETHFFRTPEHFTALSRWVLPELAVKRKRLRLWSAGCATGEEAYSLAMVVDRDFRPMRPDVHVEVLGSDLSSEAIAVAQSGRYLSPSLHGMPEEYRRYLQESGGEYRVVPEIRTAVRFFVLNLVEEASVRSMAPVDVLFCRNVLLYFTPEVRKRVVTCLVDALAPGGYLFVGATETLSGVAEGLQLVHFVRALAYRKPE